MVSFAAACEGSDLPAFILAGFGLAMIVWVLTFPIWRGQ